MKEQSTAKGFAILSAAGMMVKVISLLYIPFLRVIITDEGYGVYGAAYSVYVFIFVLTNSGIPVAISKLISELTAVKNYRDAVRSFKIARFLLLLIGIIMAVLMLALAKPLANLVNFEKAYLSILALAPSILFTSIASAYRGYFQGLHNMTPTAVSQVIEQIINTIFSLVFAVFLIKYGIEAGCAGATIGTSLGAFISAAYLIWYYERHKKLKVPKGYMELNIKRYSSKSILRKIIHYGLPITVCVGMTYAGNLVDLGNTKARLLAGGISEAYASTLYGYLVKYQQLLNVPIAIISSLAAAILPALSGAVAVEDRDAVKSKIKYAFKMCFLIAIPSAFGLSVLSGQIFEMLRFGQGAYLMAYGAVVLVLMSIMQIQTTILQSIGKLYTSTLYSFIGILVKVLVNYFLISIPSINILGAVYGSIIGYIIPIILNHNMLQKSLRLKFKFLKPALKPLVASAFMGAVVFVMYLGFHGVLKLFGNNYLAVSISTIISIIIGAYSYLFGLIVTVGISKEDLDILPRKALKLIPNLLLKKIK